MEHAAIKGCCLCGAVRFEITLPFVAFRYCHCPRCRKATGTAHASNIFVKPDQLVWLSGKDQTTRYDLREAKRFSTSFCRTCGSPVPRLSRDGTGVLVPAGSLDDDPQCKPANSIWWNHRAPWYQEPSSMPIHEEGPPA